MKDVTILGVPDRDRGHSSTPQRVLLQDNGLQKSWQGRKLRTGEPPSFAVPELCRMLNCVFCLKDRKKEAAMASPSELLATTRKFAVLGLRWVAREKCKMLVMLSHLLAPP